MPTQIEELPSDLADPVESTRMSFGDHLEELRSCVIRALIGVGLAGGVALFFGKSVILPVLFWPLFMVQRLNGLQPRLQALSPTDAFGAYFKMSLLSGLILSMPWVLHQAWRFVSTGLYPRERQFARKLTWASSGLFLVGVLFLFFLVLPIVLQFFISFNRTFEFHVGEPSSFYRTLLQLDERAEQPAPPIPSEGVLSVPILPHDPGPNGPSLFVDGSRNRLVIRSPERTFSAPLEPGSDAPAIYSEFAIEPYIAFVLGLGLAFGLAFETPLIVCFLAWSNLVSVTTMAASRKYVLFAIVVFAAVLTPPDVLSQTLLAGPMYLLFELGLKLARSRAPQPAAV